ncbi:MAG: RNA 2',3'-cyclic phosphodiesterase [Gemmatimonadetes bacterium]|nr:RNA 2',3'-cyclic phosphodiesterase [Gemmatimonadota bacterium]NIO30752.1 RNA 2',3'-cyclic phosphodiesterase [Gemmatimonadota bacterium]
MRTFVALVPSEAEQRRLADAAAGLRDAGFPIRWVRPENVHLTLKFLGEVSEGRVREVCAAVDGAADGVAPFEMAVARFGAFPSLRRPQVVWVGVELESTLQGLQESLEEALAALGFPREERAFRPHLTLGRARKHVSPNEFRGLAGLVERLKYRDAFQVRSVDVVSSNLMPTGAIYDVVHSARLES